MADEKLKIVQEQVDSCEFSQDKVYDKVAELETGKMALKEEIVYMQSQ